MIGCGPLAYPAVSPLLEADELIPVNMGELLPVWFAQGRTLHKTPRISSRAILIGVVLRKHDAIGAKYLNSALEICRMEHTTRSDVEVLSHIIGDRSLELGNPGKR